MNTVAVRTSTMAVLSLVFGITCWFALPFIGAIVAVVCGHSARSEIRQSPPGMVQGDGMAVAGLILGWVHLVFFILAILAFLMFFGGLAVIAAHV